MPGADGRRARTGYCGGIPERSPGDVREMRGASSSQRRPDRSSGHVARTPGSDRESTTRVFRLPSGPSPFSRRAGPSPGLAGRLARPLASRRVPEARRPPSTPRGDAVQAIADRKSRSTKPPDARSPVGRPSSGPPLREFSTVFNYLHAGCGARRELGILGPPPSPRRDFHSCLARLSTAVRNPPHPRPDRPARRAPPRAPV